MTSAVVISSWYTDEYKNYLRYLMNLNCSRRTPRSCSTGSLRSAAENARPVSGKLYSPVWPGPVQKQEKLNALLNILESQFRLSVVPEGKTMYVLLPQIASLKLSDVSGIFTSGYHYNKLRAK